MNLTLKSLFKQSKMSLFKVQDALSVDYNCLSEHLDMIEVSLKSTFMSTRQKNGEQLVDNVANTLGPWKG